MISNPSFIEDSLVELADYLGGRALTQAPGSLKWNNVTADSRQVTPGTIFIAYHGVSVNGHTFLSEAKANGAELCVVSDESAVPEGLPAIVVPEPRASLALLAARLYGYPARSLSCAGITGTNGKTTTHWLLYHALARLGRKPVRFGTLGCYIEGALDDRHSMTSPDADKMQRYLALAVEHGSDTAVLEVSSHAMLQKRCAGIAFETCAFTNLTSDHLDYHPDMEAYYQAKKLLFAQTRSFVANRDCEYGRRLLDEVGSKMPHLSFGKDPDAALRMSSFKQHAGGSTLTLSFESKEYTVRTDFIGEYNGYNLCCAFALCLQMGFEPQKIAVALSGSPQVPGRLERYSYKGATVIIDYAYAPDALENVLLTLREVTASRLWVLFGCGGERDRGRRTGMGEVARKLADKVVLTTDNPRREDPQQIMDDILSSGVRPEFIEPDRSVAISRTMKQLQQGDVLVVSGKGHEEYQILGTKKIHLSDREEVLKVIEGQV